MKKAFMLGATLLVLLTVVFASGYRAEVANAVGVRIVNTSKANLAFIRKDDMIARSILSYDGGSLVVDFGKVQPNSAYVFSEVLTIKNNEPFPVKLYISRGEDLMLKTHPSDGISVWVFMGTEPDGFYFWRDGGYWPDLAGSTYLLAASGSDGDSVQVGFFISVCSEYYEYTEPEDLTGTIVWRAVAGDISPP